jgi:stage III sporulation protein AD
VIRFLDKVQRIAELDPELTGILLKITAVSFIAEIATLVCQDAGNAALGKSLQLLAMAVILWLSGPILERLLALAERILVNL